MKQVTKIFLFTVFIGQLAYSNAQSQSEGIAQDVSAKEFAVLIANGNGLLLDVRTPGEFNDGHIGDAQHINFYDDDFKSQIEKLDKEKPVYVYCAAGGRSAKAMNIMYEVGFKKVYNLLGGYGAWSSGKK
ncbi:MAG: hypothetical protein COA57_08795 [Flavobacteriales bacterium]|nr:MAG: hypothetical protein COA57_08795 [Flavobacteriales bacterium]